MPIGQRKSGQRSGKTEVAKPDQGHGAKRWLVRFCLVVAFPLLFLLVVEFILRVAGYGYPTDFVLTSADGRYYRDNQSFTWQFYSRNSNLRPHPFRISREKSEDEFRIVVLGESAAVGTPEPGFGFAKMLERMLTLSFPELKVDVITAATRGINSNILRHVAQDCLALSPDLFLVYMGNNEAVGLYAPTSSEDPGLSDSARQWMEGFRASRLGQLMWEQLKLAKQPDYNEQQDMDFFRQRRLHSEGEGIRQVAARFKANLMAIVESSRAHNVPVMISSVGVNLKDFPPLGSLSSDLSKAEPSQEFKDALGQGERWQKRNQSGKAIAAYNQALDLEKGYAEVWFRLGQCHLALKEHEQALGCFQKAADLDALPFRATSTLNGLSAEVAETARSENVLFVDVATELNSRAADSAGVAGREFFYDHVHFNFDGDYQVSSILCPEVVRLIEAKAGIKASLQEVPSRDVVASSLGWNRISETQLYSAMLDSMSHPPFLDQANHTNLIGQLKLWLRHEFGDLGQKDIEIGLKRFEQAKKDYPIDWELPYNLGQMYSALGKHQEALTAYRKARDLLPHSALLRFRLANAYARAGFPNDARTELESLLEIEANYAPAIQALKSMGRN